MKRLSLIILAVMASLPSIIAQDQHPPVKAEENPNSPEITFDKLVHDYGTVAFSGDGVSVFKFTNTGKEPLILQQPQSSCGCTVPTWPKEPILPGESSEIKVTYNTKRAGPINKTVTIRSNAKNGMIVLRITGKVEADTAQKLPEKTAGEGTPINR
ncbi:MAG: DUF1573 domain-containing protein [Bacteroidales bacterium]|nr:DUF1573 domain-containing protein [Bacteroidales bacterium]